MYVYLKFGPVIKIIHNVTIDEDCSPVVDGKRVLDSPREGESSTPNSKTIDAIAWFKSLPMEAVYIDCSTRDARWCPKSLTIRDNTEDPDPITRPPSVRLRKKPGQVPLPGPGSAAAETEDVPFMPESARPLFAEHPGVVDFNPVIDEMFERLEELIASWDHLSENGEINREVAKILHCYVFPAVSFQKEDIPVLQERMRIIIMKQKTIENDIVDKQKNIGVTETYLNRKKEVILANEEMTTQSYLQACDRDFLTMLYSRVTKDLQNKNMRLDILQMKINGLKKSGQDEEELRKLQKDRDAVHDLIQKLLGVREALCTHLFRSSLAKKKKKKLKRRKLNEKELSLHDSFVQVHEQLIKDKDQLKRLCYRKLHAASVREAIESTLKLLRLERPGTQGDFSEFSIYNGPRGSNKKQWKSMQSRVDGWMSTDGSLYNVHMEGCQLIKDLAEGMLSDSQIASMGLDPSMVVFSELKEENLDDAAAAAVAPVADGWNVVTSASGAVSGVGDAGDTGTEDICSKRAHMVDIIKEQVLVHTSDMAERIVNKMNFDASPGSRHINRAWVCYDPYFWKEAGKAVERVYMHYHGDQARKVHHRVSSSAIADIMDSNFFKEFFVHGADLDRESTGESSSGTATPVRMQSADAVSALSLDLQRCSVTDLYARVNKDGARLNCQMLEMGSLRPSVASLDSHSSSDSNDPGKNSLSGVEESSGNNRSDSPEVLHRENSSASDSGTSIHSEDLYDTDGSISDLTSQETREREAIRGSQTVASVLSLYNSIVDPYHEKVQEVLSAPSVMEKMKAVWQSVDFLSKKTGEMCKARGMDTLLPMSIFATSSFSEELFTKYYIQLMILTDLKPSFTFHSMYDFSLTNAFSTYMFLFEDRLRRRGHEEESDSSTQA